LTGENVESLPVPVTQ